MTADTSPLLKHAHKGFYGSPTNSLGLSEATPDPTRPSTPQPFILNKISHADLIWILTGIWSAVFLGALDGTIVATLISPIGSYFGKSHQASYLGTSYLLSVCCFTPLYGRLSDIIGRKYAMLLALSLFGLGTISCAVAPTMEALIAARALAGMGGGGVMTVSSVIASDLIPLKNRGLFQGLANVLFGLGAGIGGPLGGYISDVFGWRLAFAIQVPMLCLSATIVALKVNIVLPMPISTYSPWSRIDFLGSFALILCIGPLLLGCSLKTSEDLNWSDPIICSLFAISAVMAPVFLWVEARWSREPVMPLRLLRRKTPLAVALTNFFVSMNGFSMLYNVPLYFSAVRLASATDAGLHLLPNSIALSAGSVFAGWYMRHTGKFWNLAVWSSFLPFVSSILVCSWTAKTSSFHLWWDITLSGFGTSSVITTTLIALIACVSREDQATVTGVSYLFRTTGQVLGVSLSGALVQGILSSRLQRSITGPDAPQIIARIRHSTSIIPTLEPAHREAAVKAYAGALRATFFCQAVVAFMAFLCSLPIEEHPLPGSHEERAEFDRRRRQGREVGNHDFD